MTRHYCGNQLLTYMSIRDQIKTHLGTKLFYLPLAVRSDELVRELIVSDEVRSAVEGPFDETRDGYRCAQFRAYLDAFAGGEEIGVSEKPFNKRADTFLARVHPTSLGVWDIRAIEPRPGIRCFGCFGDYDLFVALIWDYRENIEETPEGFEILARECRRVWDKFFSYPPRQGPINDLLSNFYAS